jgi:SAM-dependent methyltransferase
MGRPGIAGNYGTPRCTYSGYHFKLAKGFLEKKLPMFDMAYVDGGHVFHLDAPAAIVLKELCNPGGLILFDDWNWSIAKSPSLKPSVKPEILEHYDGEQIKACHVQMVCKTVMDTDPRFEFLGVKLDTATYRKKV